MTLFFLVNLPLLTLYLSITIYHYLSFSITIDHYLSRLLSIPIYRHIYHYPYYLLLYFMATIYHYITIYKYIYIYIYIINLFLYFTINLSITHYLLLDLSHLSLSIRSFLYPSIFFYLPHFFYLEGFFEPRLQSDLIMGHSCTYSVNFMEDPYICSNFSIPLQLIHIFAGHLGEVTCLLQYPGLVRHLYSFEI